MSAKTVLKLYRTLINNKYLVYPKYKGFQAQVMFYHPYYKGYYSEMGQMAESQIYACGFYGFPINYKTSLSFYGFFSKVFKKEIQPDYYYLLNPGRTSSIIALIPPVNIFQLIVGRTQLDRLNNSYTSHYNPEHVRNTDFYFGSTIEVFHNFTGFIGLRGYINSTAYNQNSKLKSDLTQLLFLDFGILNKLILTGRLSSYMMFEKGYPPRYYFETFAYITYTLF